MPGDVGAVATLLNTLAQWFTDPDGYKAMNRDAKLKALREGIDAALKAGAYDAADRLFCEYRRMYEEAAG